MTALRAVPDDGEGRRFSAPEVCTATGVTYRVLDYWARSGLLDDNAAGSGSHRTFTAYQVDVVRHVRGLLAAGFVLRAAFPIARELAQTGLWISDVTDPLRITVNIPPSKEH